MITLALALATALPSGPAINRPEAAPQSATETMPPPAAASTDAAPAKAEARFQLADAGGMHKWFLQGFFEFWKEQRHERGVTMSGRA
jgi:hypothetical protein